MKKILLSVLMFSLNASLNVLAISPTFSNPTGSSMDFYPMMQHQMEKEETLDFVNDSENYKEKRAHKDAENEYRAGNKNFNPAYGTETSLKKFYNKNNSMKFSTDNNGNIIIKNSEGN